MKLANIKKAYLVGIKGTGMSAAAQILKSRGADVSGSDTSEYFFTQDMLDRLGIKYFESFDPAHITDDIDVVLYSTAYDVSRNPELKAAQEKKIPLMQYPEFLGTLSRERLSIAICGSHGKTTTTALLAHVLQVAGEDPSAIVGSRVNNWNGAALSGNGKHFVFEADEYQNKFQHYVPWSVILTSVDWDHPDFFPTEKEYRDAFTRFLKKAMPHGFVVVCADDADAVEVAKASGRQFVTYGFSESADVTIHERAGVSNEFAVQYHGKPVGDFSMRLTGAHNALNAAAVIAMCALLKIDMNKVREGVKSFTGTARRFETVGEYAGAILIDDYAHHPRELQTVLRAAREKYSHKNIIAVFQPHTFTRTKAFFEEFAQSFMHAGRVIVLDIYASERERVANRDISSEQLVEKINRYEHGKAEYAPSIDAAVEMLHDAGKNDIVLTLGAGDVWRVGKQLTENSE